ncbi:MAG: hypothetical protein JNK86_03875 [Alphaproteobacteria bacterium]|nr:hypothetical protein [Alphaproteobacteria bacterium]
MMSLQAIEWAPFKKKANISEADLISASDIFQKNFLEKLPGFLRRELLKKDQDHYIDIVWWRTQADAANAIKQAMISETCRAYFFVMDSECNDPGEGVQHYHLMKTYLPL